jgi:hypothetical protein
MEDRYQILYKGTPLQTHGGAPLPPEGLTQEQMFSIMDDLSEAYYKLGKPDPQDLEVKFITTEEN